MLAASKYGSEGEPGCPRLSQVATIVGGHESRARSALIVPLKKNKKKNKVSVQIQRLLPLLPPYPHPAIFTIMHMHCHKSNALS